MKILVLAALEIETYALKNIIHTGVGKINATIKTVESIKKFKPDKIINYGSAGTLKGISGLVKCTKFVQRDMDARGLGFDLGQTPYDNISSIIFDEQGYTCASGDTFVNSSQKIDYDVVDMEAYAIAKCCILYNISFECYKYISDQANHNAQKDWIENCKKGAVLFKKKFPNLV